MQLSTDSNISSVCILVYQSMSCLIRPCLNFAQEFDGARYPDILIHASLTRPIRLLHNSAQKMWTLHNLWCPHGLSDGPGGPSRNRCLKKAVSQVRCCSQKTCSVTKRRANRSPEMDHSPNISMRLLLCQKVHLAHTHIPCLLLLDVKIYFLKKVNED